VKSSSLKSSRRATSTLLKFFKSSYSSSSSSKPEVATFSTATIRPSATAKSYTKQISCESTTAVAAVTAETEDLNESDMSVVGLPPTPLKPPAAHNNGVSSQILPLHRLSSETVLPPRSASGVAMLPPPPPAYKEPPRPKTTTSSEALLSKHKPVAEVSPFSSAQVCLVSGIEE
jgi:hypothetical protein